MKLQIKLFATLRKFNPLDEEIELDDGLRVIDFLNRFGIPTSEVAVILVDGRHANLEQPLHDGETLAIFPPIAGG